MAAISNEMRLLLIIGFFSVFFPAGAQISRGGSPLLPKNFQSLSIPYFLPREEVTRAILRNLEEEDILRGKKPMKIGVYTNTDLSPENAGQWVNIQGKDVWRLEVFSPQGLALSPFFSEFKLQPGSMVFIYDENKEVVLGGFNHENNKESGSLAAGFVPGDRMIIELQTRDKFGYGDLRIGSITHAFVDLFGISDKKDSYYGLSGFCNLDVNCNEGNSWQEIKKAVCRIIFKSGTFSTEVCTGTLINNTSEDGTPYIYTANHCLRNASHAESAVFYFGYEADNCNGPDPDPDGLLTNSISTSAILATSDSLDFTLLLLSESPPKPFSPVYAGWSRSSLPPDNTHVIHHPQGDVKKIAADYDPAVIEYQQENPPNWLYNGSVPGAFWRVVEWEFGTTEGGSSGSPLFNEDQRIVGNLTGGDASCFNPINDYFSKFYLNWDYYPEPNMQLKFWLDPDGTNLQGLDLFNPYDDTSTPEIELFEVIPNPVKDDFFINTNGLNLKDVRIRIWNIQGALLSDYFLESAEILRLSFSEFPSGIYILEVHSGQLTERKKIVVAR